MRDKEGWREVWRIEVPEPWKDRGAQAWWNEEFGVCVLRVWYDWHVKADSSLPTRDAHCFTYYTEAIAWAQTRLQEMWDKWVAWEAVEEDKRAQERGRVSRDSGQIK